MDNVRREENMKKSEGKKSYAVFGLGEFGRSVALELMAAGADGARM